MPGRYKTAVNFIITAVFLFLAAVIIAPLLAEAQFDIAGRLAAKSSFQDAASKFEKAVSMDPFNSRSLAGYAGLLKRAGSSLNVKIPELIKAEKLYERALALNPRHAEYALGLGQARIGLFLSGRKDFSGNLKKGFNDFKTAVRNDPNGFNISYSVGYAGLAIWEFLDQDEKAFTLERLKYSLKIKPYYAKHVYSKMWQRTEDFRLLQRITPENTQSNKNLYNFVMSNNLWRFRKAQSEVVSYYQLKEAAGPEKDVKKERIEKIKELARRAPKISNIILKEDWRGESLSGKNSYKDGNMYWTGTVDAPILAPEGGATVKIEAKGAPADGVYPYMIVEFNGETVGETFVYSAQWQKYCFPVNTEGGVKVLSVTFANDGSNRKKQEDRNLYIGKAEVIKNER